MRLLIFHTGNLNSNYYEKFFKMIEKLNHNLIGFTSLENKNNFNKIGDYTVYPTNSVVMLKFDKILIGEYSVENIKILREIFINLGIPAEKISGINWLLQQVMIRKYEDIYDIAIQDTIAYWQTHELSVFNQHTENYKHTYDEVHIDESCNLPYINFQTVENKQRRMYYPRGRNFFKGDDGKDYVKDILREQVLTSPHLYIKGKHKVDEGDILIDAGVCEGNFALRYVDICSKVYLFEPDPVWFEPLYYSFRDCWDKIEFIPKAVGENTHGNLVKLDDVVNVPVESKMFLKMDVEGAEPAALRGANKILSTNKVKASICSYHNTDDIIKIKSVFKNHGYRIATSEGYMVFIWDEKILETADFRKGIVYATNC